MYFFISLSIPSRIINNNKKLKLNMGPIPKVKEEDIIDRNFLYF